jgi:hypothetical protein
MAVMLSPSQARYIGLERGDIGKLMKNNQADDIKLPIYLTDISRIDNLYLSGVA